MTQLRHQRHQIVWRSSRNSALSSGQSEPLRLLRAEERNRGHTMFELRTCDWLPLSVLGCALLAVIQTAAAQNFPSRPLTLVVPFAAGGPSDVAGRIVAQGLTEKLGRRVVLEDAVVEGGSLGSLWTLGGGPV